MSNDLLSACIDVSLALSLGAVEAGALKNNINVKLAPGKILRVGHSIDSDLLTVNYDSAGNLDSLAVLFILSSLEVYGVKILAYSSAIAALSGIVLEKVCKQKFTPPTRRYGTLFLIHFSSNARDCAFVR